MEKSKSLAVTENHETSQPAEEMQIDIELLSDRQRAAIPLILAGRSDVEVAEQVGVARETICRWKSTNHFFIGALNAERISLWEAAEDRLLGLADKAVCVIEQELDKGNPKIALSILNLIGKQLQPCYEHADGEDMVWRNVEQLIPKDEFDILGIKTSQRRLAKYKELRDQYLSDR